MSSELQPKRRSCALCKRYKVKCLGGPPCRRCIESKVTCTPQAPGPKSLLERVSSLEKNHNASSKIIQDLQREIAKLKGEQPGAEPDESTDTDDDTQSQTAELVEDPDRSEQVSDEEDGENLGLLGTTRSGKRKRYGLPTLPYENGHKRPRAGNEFGESGITSVEEEVALQIFFSRCVNKLPFIDAPADLDLPSIKRDQPLLYWTMVAIGSREAHELASIHAYAEQQSIDRAQKTLFGTTVTMEDLKALLMIGMFLREARSPGHAIGIAHDIRLSDRCMELSREYEEFQKISHDPEALYPGAQELCQLMRVYGYLFMLDRVTSYVADQPYLLISNEPVQMIEQMLTLPCIRMTDTRLAAQVHLVNHMSNVRSSFTSSSQDKLDLVPAHNQALDAWFKRWIAATEDWRGHTSEDDVNQLQTSLRFLYASSRLYINAFLLQGITHASQIGPDRMTCLNECVVAARTVCVQAVRHDQPNNIIYTSNITQLQLTFAAVFLVRMIRLLPRQFEEERIIREIKDLGDLLSQISGRYYSRRIDRMLDHIESNRRSRPNDLFASAQTRLSDPGRGTVYRSDEFEHTGSGWGTEMWEGDWIVQLGSAAFWDSMREEDLG